MMRDTFTGKNWLFRKFLRAARRDRVPVSTVEKQFREIAYAWGYTEAYRYIERS